MESKTKLRFGISSPDLRFSAWEAETIERLLDSGLAELVVAVNDPPDPEPAPWAPGDFLHRCYEAFWVRRRSRALRPAGSTPWLAALDIADWSEDLGKHRLDFVLRFGSSPLPVDALASIPGGVWSFDPPRARATSACFWPVARGESRTEINLVRLREGTAPAVLHRGFFGTCKASWVNNLDRALLGSAEFASRACAEIVAQRSATPEPIAPARPAAGGEPRLPGNGDFLGFLAHAATHAVRKLWELLFHLEVWNVGCSKEPLEQIVRRGQIDHATISWCAPHRSGAFIADPFGHGANGQEEILVEEYDEGGKGRICRLERPQAGRPLELDVAIEEPHHMSYPCLFSEGGQLYCIPETYQANGARIYRRHDRRWELVRTIVDGQPIVDPTLFRHDGRYWLLCTLQNDGCWGNLKLHGYYAESLFSEWRAHPLNPLKCDIGSSRPAGRVVEIDGALYRPSQDCSDTYGGAVVINRVVKLSPTEFDETVAATIRPLADGPYPDGLHTMNALADGTIIDGKKFTFDLRAWKLNWGRLHEVFR